MDQQLIKRIYPEESSFLMAICKAINRLDQVILTGDKRNSKEL